MDFEFSLAHLTALPCNPPELINIAAEAGYNYVSLRMTAVADAEDPYPLMTNRALMKETKDQLAATGMSVLDVELVRLDPDTEPESFTRFFEAGAELGAKAVIAQLPDPDTQRATDRFADLCDLAAQSNLTVNLEFPSWLEVGNLQQAVDVLSAVGKSNAGILVDTLHFARSDSDLDQLRKLPRKWFNFIHLCDAIGETPDTTEGVIFTAREDRVFPGLGTLPVREILECMPNVPYSLEIPNNTLYEELGAAEYVKRALDTSREFLKKNFDASSNRHESLKKAVNS